MTRLTALVLGATILLGACANDGEPRSPSVETGPTGSSPGSPTTGSPSPSPSSMPSAGSKVRFAVIGDWGSGLPAQQEVADRMCRWRAKHPFDDVFTTGDNIYPDGDPALFDDYFFRPYECLLSDGVRWHAALGNHDIVIEDGEAELSEPAFGFEGRNYVVQLDGVRFVVADSNDLKLRFLRRKTRRAPSVMATIVLFHHPVMSAGDSHGPTPGMAEKLLGLFADRGVDLVLNGHDHVYSRSKAVGGVRYVVTGGGGAKLNGCRAAIGIVRCEAHYHFLYVVAADDALTVRVVPATGRPFDRFEVPYNP